LFKFLISNDFSLIQIQERDEDALKFLKDIKWSRIDNPKGFKLEFFFDSNPYFKNSVLTKTYHMIDDDDEPILEKAIGYFFLLFASSVFFFNVLYAY